VLLNAFGRYIVTVMIYLAIYLEACKLFLIFFLAFINDKIYKYFFLIEMENCSFVFNMSGNRYFPGRGIELQCFIKGRE
jgi:hypothetical protein